MFKLNTAKVILDGFTEKLILNESWLKKLARTELADLSQEHATGDLHSLGEEVLRRFIEDVRITFSLISQGLDQIESDPKNASVSILEVGAGIGLTYAVLKKMGYNMIAIEPSARGHDGYYELGHSMLNLLGIAHEGWFSLSASELGGLGQKFDLIISNNVLEHISDLSQAFSTMCQILKPKGRMLHNCPNYLIPYEPHYSFVFVPFAPKLMELVQPHLKQRGLWQSLNFLTSFTLFKLARKNGITLQFDNHHFRNTLSRLDTDPLFRNKHRVVAILYSALKKLGLASLLPLIPGWLMTPIQFSGSRK